MDLRHLGLRSWPFVQALTPESVKIWAGRKEERSNFQKLFRELSRRDTSSIHLVWGWTGAGKSHSLLHFAALCASEYPTLAPVYTVYPVSGLRSFFELYQLFVESLDLNLITALYAKLIDHLGAAGFHKTICPGFPIFEKALRLLRFGGEVEKPIASAWLRGERIDLRTLRQYGIDDRLEDDRAAQKAIVSISRLVGSSKTFRRLVWIIDEFQRIANKVGRSNPMQLINDTLQTIYDACPTSLSLILSFSTRVRAAIDQYLSDAVRSRIGPQKILAFPPFDAAQAREFVTGVIAAYRSDGFQTAHLPHFPFDDTAIHAALELMETANRELIPREIIQVFDRILQEAEAELEAGTLPAIDGPFVHRVLQGFFTES